MGKIRQKLSKEANTIINVNMEKLGRRRLVSIISEWGMFSILWNFFFFQYLNAHIRGFSGLFSLDMATIVVVCTIYIVVDVFVEIVLYKLSRAFIDFVFTGEFNPFKDKGEQ